VWKASVKWEDDFDGGLGVKEKKVVGIRICRGFVLGVWIDGDWWKMVIAVGSLYDDDEEGYWGGLWLVS